MMSPGRKAMAKECAPKRIKKRRWTYKGEVPQVIAEDREFYLLFCESKEIEHTADPRQQARFFTIQEAMRRRWIQLMDPPPENPATRLLKLLDRKNDDGRRPPTESENIDGN